jgi:hypothetical protein
VEAAMKYTKNELLDMKAEELNKVLLRQPVYMISEYGGALLFGAIDEEKMCGGWKFYKIDWHNKDDIEDQELQPDEWVRCDKVSKFSVKKMSRLLRYNYTY